MTRSAATQTAEKPFVCRHRSPEMARLAPPRRMSPEIGEQDPAVAELVAQVSASTYRDYLTAITKPDSRHSFGAGFRDVMDFAATPTSAWGFSVSRATVAVGTGTTENLVADRPGTAPGTRNLIVVTAHLDSINHEDGIDAPAPGADDNAGGCAGVLELGRILATSTWRHDLRLILFGGEEQGLFGSRAHVAGMSADDRARIRAVINMDMIGRRHTDTPGVLIEAGEVSRELAGDLTAAAGTWTDLAVSVSSNPFGSDHVPFIDAGLPAVLTIEADDGANNDDHSARDTLDKLDITLALQILKMNLATLAGYLGRP